MMRTPFIHLVDTPYGFYFFDVNTHTIQKVDKAVYQGLKLILDKKEDEKVKEILTE